MFALGNLSHFSFHRSLLSPEKIVELGKQRGYAGVGLSDWFGFWGSVPFQKACEKAGMKCVHGARFLVSDLGEVQVVLRGEAGFRAVSRVFGAWQLEFGQSNDSAGWRLWPASFVVPREVFRSWLQSLDGLTADSLVWLFPITSETQTPFAGMQQSVLVNDSPHPPLFRWRERFVWLRDAVGASRAFAELRPLRPPTASFQRALFMSWEQIMKEPLPVIFNTAARLSHGGQEDALSINEAIGLLLLRGDSHPHRSLKNLQAVLPPADEVIRVFQRRREILQQTEALVEACSFRFELERLFIPGIGSGVMRHSRGRGSDTGTADQELRRLCMIGLGKRYSEECYPWPVMPSKAMLRDRLNSELKIVQETGYAGYFLIFYHIVERCRESGIDLLARGSAAGSLICYSLGVSNVCPFRFGLSFERFLNRDRLAFSKLPDIDLDLPWDRRDEIIESVYKDYGAERVAMIGGFNCFKARAALADVARTLGVPERKAREWTRFLPQGSVGRFLRERQHWVEVGDLENEDSDMEEIIRAALELDGRPRHPMMHPCGIVIADRPIDHFSPLIPSHKGFVMTQMDMDAVEDLGLLKLDLLGQAGLSVLRDAEANIAEDPWVDFDFHDPEVYAAIRRGGARGIFHIESPAMTQLLKLCQCADIDCLVATVSVIRPGAANDDKKNAFARRYLGLEKPRYLDPDLEPILRDTFGLMVYEEHIIFVAHHWAGLDLGTADRLRRILVKKKEGSELDAIYDQFRKTAIKLGRRPGIVEQVWRMLVDFSGYMFNKAHGAAYAVEAFRGMWLKLKWPGAFLAAVLQNERGFYHPVVYVAEALHRGILIELPDVQSMEISYRWKAVGSEDGQGGVIQVPLKQIKGLTERFLNRWKLVRQDGPFVNYRDFLNRTQPGLEDLLKLAKAGALRAFFSSRRQAIYKVRRRELVARLGKEDAGTLFLPNWGDPEAVDSPCLKADEPFELARWEEGLLGFPVTLPPWQAVRGGALCSSDTTLSDAAEVKERELTVSGRIVVRRGHTTRKGERMSFFTLVDATGFLEVTVFPEAYKKFAYRIARSEWVRIRVYEGELRDVLVS